jgi:hypothetical protein
MTPLLLKKSVIASVLVIASFTSGVAQSPGLIVRPAGGPYSATLNPLQHGYTSTSASGFNLNDIAESEIPYKVVPPAVTEPTGDLATGPSGGFTDIVKTVDNSGFYVYSNGTNLHFRLRIGGIISGSKGYSILIDTDGRMGNSGPYADENYVAPTNTSKGNPGFEFEVVFQTNFRVEVYTVNSLGNPVSTSNYPLNTHSQISVALSKDGNNPDYFYDWYVPLSAIGSPASIRMAATTVTSPTSALQGSRSDIYGINDATSSVTDAWQTVIKAQPFISITPGGIGAVGATCTAAPSLNAPVPVGSSIAVTGSWTRMDASKPSTATIILFRNQLAIDSTVVNTGNIWTISVPTVSSGNVFYAKARAFGESECLQSASVTASGCPALPAAPVITCASQKGLTGTIPLNSTILLYQVTSANGDPATSPITLNISYPTTTSFAYYNAGCSGTGSPLTSGLSYMMKTVSSTGCVSGSTLICIQGSSSVNTLPTNTISITTPVYPFQTSLTVSNATAGELIRLFINDIYVSSQVASGASFNFDGLTMKAGDEIKIYSQGTTCMTVSNTFSVSCYNLPPIINTDANGKLLSTSTSITGTSAANAAITLNRTSPTAASWSTTANSSGSWTVNGLTLAANDIYTAIVSSTSECLTPSQASSSASVVAPTTVCPTFGGSYTDNSISVGGSITTAATGTVRLYLDDVLLGFYNVTSTGTSAWSVSSLSYPLYNGGLLRASFQAGTNAENAGCATTVVSCTSPIVPVISPTSSTIASGQTINYNVSNVAGSTWYAVMDNSGTSYATSLYTSNTNPVSISTKAFNTTGTYNLRVSADKLSGCPPSYATASVLVYQLSMPVTFERITAKNYNGTIKVKWDVSDEVNVMHYVLERSYNCKDFEVIGLVPFKVSASSVNHYEFEDKSVQSSSTICYRVKQVDNNQDFTYSTIVSASGTQGAEVTLWPNPAVSRVTINLDIPQTTTPAKVELYDVNGRRLLIKHMAAGSNTFSFDKLDMFPRGNYLLKVSADHYARK